MDTINSYVYRGQRPQPLGIPAPKRIQAPGAERLSTILENGNTGTANARRNSAGLTNLPWDRSQHHGEPPLETEEKRPPSYETQGSSGGRFGGNSDDVRPQSNDLIARLRRRGGLKRLALLLFAAIVVLAVALGVGLGVGLNQDSKKTTSNSATTTSTPSISGPFPAGAYALEPFLTNVTSSCTSNPSTWSCYPYTTYSSSPSDSEAAFDWIITESSPSSNTFLISSTNNPLSVIFTNATLTLVDANTSQERYTFSVPNVVKNVIPPVSLSDDNTRSTCFYNSTTLRASLYTRMNATLIDSSGSTPKAMVVDAADGLTFNRTWPGAIMIEQVTLGGNDVPNCYQLQDGHAVGQQIQVPTESSSTDCSCLYMNFS